MTERIKVLMVDDEEQFRTTTSKILSRRGYETTMAASGEEALEILKTSDQDVVILDIKMPGMDGHEALARIKDMRPDIQVIMLTGHGTMDSAKESLKYKAFEYLNKPCDVDLLTAKIHDAYRISKGGIRAEKTAGDIMIPLKEYTTIKAESTVSEGIERLKRSYEDFVATGRIMETGHRSILVFDRKEVLVGILSILDLIQALRPAYLSAPKPSMADTLQYSPMFWSGLFTSQAKALLKMKVWDIMSEPPPMVEEDANLMEIVETMYTTGARRLGVIGREKVAGVVREQEVFFEIARIALDS